MVVYIDEQRMSRTLQSFLVIDAAGARLLLFSCNSSLKVQLYRNQSRVCLRVIINCAFLTSYERDNESELDYAQARMYASKLGRFTTTDPIFIEMKRLSDPQRFNLFLYSRNNPLAYTDPLGMDIKALVDEKLTDDEKKALYKKYETYLEAISKPVDVNCCTNKT